MSYLRAEDVLPKNIIEMIQQYVDGENIYIPKKSDCRSDWGSRSGIKKELEERNSCIFADYVSGKTIPELADHYCLSDKSIQRIILQCKKK